MYFDDNDYNVFVSANAKNTMISADRIRVRDKLLALHSDIYKTLNQKYHLYCHPSNNEKNNRLVTSSIERSQFPPHHYNSYVFVRYELQPIDNMYCRFIHQMSLQFGIFENKDFCIGLYLGTKNSGNSSEGSWTRMKIKQHNTTFNQVNFEIEKLKGKGLKWEVLEKTSENEMEYACPPFDIDLDDSMKFHEWIKRNDDKGDESFLEFTYNRNDELLKTKASIENEILEKIELLLPLYKAFPNYNSK